MQNTAEPIDSEAKARLSAALKSLFEEERKLLESDICQAAKDGTAGSRNEGTGPGMRLRRRGAKEVQVAKRAKAVCCYTLAYTCDP